MKRNKKNLLSIVAFAAKTILLIMLIGVALVSFSSRLPVLSKRGLNFFSVTSGSMEPAIPVGALIHVSDYELEQLSKGDVITYRVSDSLVTHRIVEVLKQETTRIYEMGGEKEERKVMRYEYVTKGDANNDIDKEQVSAGDIVGKYVWHVPKVGYVAEFVKTQRGFLLFIVAPAMILVVWELVTMIAVVKEHYEKKAMEEIEKYRKQFDNG